MTDNNRSNPQKANGGHDTNDLAEMLRKLRETVEKPVSERSGGKLDESLEKELRAKIEGASANRQESKSTSADPKEASFDSGEFDEETAPEEIIEEESIEEEMTEEEGIEEGVAAESFEKETEGGFEFDDDAPWYSDDEEDEETEEEVIEEEIIEEEVIEEESVTEDVATETFEEETEGGFEFDDDAPWYSDDEEVEETEEEIIVDDIIEEEIVEEEIIEEEIIEDDIIEDDIIEEEIIEEEIIEEEEVLDSTDISLLNNLGYGTVIDDKTGKEELVHLEERETDFDEDAGDIAYDYDGGEYFVEEQTDDIMSGYRREKKKILTRLAITGGASLLTLLYEALFFSGVTMPWIFNQYESPFTHVMISFQLLLIVFAVSARQMTVGIRDLFTYRATPYSLSAAVILANAVYTLAVAFISPDGYMLFNFVGAVAALMAVAYEYLLLWHEEKTFEVVSDGESSQSYAFETDEHSGEVVDEAVYALRAYRTEFNQNYFSRTRKRPEDYKYLGTLIFAIFGVAVISGAVSLILTGNVGESLKLLVLVINFAMPLGALGAFCLPMVAASKKMLGNKSAMIGQSVVDEYCDVGFVTFDEEELFPSMKASHIDFKPSGDLPVVEILRKTRLMFSCIGGPIKRLVESPFEDIPEDCTVSINSVLDDGVSAYVDGSMMLAGSAQFLELHGVNVKESRDSRDSDASNRVLYVSIDGVLAARYYIKYRSDKDFVRMVNKLGEKGVAVGIRTRNPGVNSDIIAEYCPEMKYKVYTVKSWTEDSEDAVSSRDTTESGLYAKGKAVFLSKPLVAVKVLKSIYRTDRTIRIISSAAGAALVIAMAAFGLLREFNSVQAALYQIAWVIPPAVVTFVQFFRKK